MKTTTNDIQQEQIDRINAIKNFIIRLMAQEDVPPEFERVLKENLLNILSRTK